MLQEEAKAAVMGDLDEAIDGLAASIPPADSFPGLGDLVVVEEFEKDNDANRCVVRVVLCVAVYACSGL